MLGALVRGMVLLGSRQDDCLWAGRKKEVTRPGEWETSLQRVDKGKREARFAESGPSRAVSRGRVTSSNLYKAVEGVALLQRRGCSERPSTKHR